MDSIEIPRSTVEMLEAQLDKAIKVCNEAGPTDFENLNQPPELTYAGATGWSRAAMEQTLFQFFVVGLVISTTSLINPSL